MCEGRGRGEVVLSNVETLVMLLFLIHGFLVLSLSGRGGGRVLLDLLGILSLLVLCLSA